MLKSLDLEEYLALLAGPKAGLSPVSAILARLCRDLSVPYGTIWLYEPENLCLALLASKGYKQADLLRFSRLSVSRPLPTPASITAKAFVLNREVRATRHDIDNIARATGVEFTLAVPIPGPTGTLGVLTLEDSNEDAFSSFDSTQTFTFLQSVLHAALTKRHQSVSQFLAFLVAHASDEPTGLHYGKVSQWLQRELRADYCAVYQLNKAGSLVIRGASYGGKDITDQYANANSASAEGLTGWAAKRRLVLRVIDPQAPDSQELGWYKAKYPDDRVAWRETTATDPPFNFASVPLVEGRKLLGVMRLSDSHLHFDRSTETLELHSLDILSGVAGALASAMTSAERRIKANFLQSELLFGPAASLEEVITASIEDLVRATAATNAFVLLQDTDELEQYTLYLRDSPDRTLEKDELLSGSSIVGKVLSKGGHISTVDTPDLAATPVVTGLGELDGRSVVAAPLFARKGSEPRKLVGVLVATSRTSDALSHEDVAAVSIASSRIMDKVHLFMCEVEIAEQRSRIERWERAAIAGLYASSEAHTIRKFVTTMVPRIHRVLDSDLVKRDAEAEAEAKAIRPQLASLQKQADRLQKFFRTKRIVRERHELRPILQQACDELERQVRVRHARLSRELDADVYANVDPLGIRAVVENLIYNSLEAQATKISVRLGHSRSDHGRLVGISVIDDGIGIRANRWSLVFEPFFSENKPKEGSGLGLWTCREVAREHGGMIEITESRPHERTVITLTLPPS